MKARIDDSTIILLALIAYKYGEISKMRCAEITGIRPDDIKDEARKRVGEVKFGEVRII